MNANAPDIEDLEDQLDAAEGDAQALAAGLAEEQGGWYAETGSWSVAECLDHLAIANRVYLQAMVGEAIHAREQGRFRRGPMALGFVGRWFVRTMEPPVRAPFRMKAPRIIKPRAAPPLANAFASFRTSQDEVRAFLCAYADLDLAAVRFPNPFARGIHFSLATGLHLITAHERRHLWQAWQVRRAAEGVAAELSRNDSKRTKGQCERNAMDFRLEKLKENLESAVEGMSSEQLSWHLPGKWCAAEVLEHLYLTYTGTIQGFERVMRKTKPLASRASMAHRVLTLVVVGVGYVPAGLKAPAVAQPRGLPSEKVRNEIGEKIAAMNAIIAQCEARFGPWVHLLDHPILGPLSATQFRKLHLVHGQHHLKQLLRLRERTTRQMD